MRVARHGVSAELPAGWDARVYRRDADEAGATTHSVLHAATFPLPPGRGDFGSGAVERMGRGDVFVALIEFHPDAAATPLFARKGLPRRLEPASFGPNRLQRALPGQSGTQRFFSADGRAFCLYVVLGDDRRREALLPAVHRLLAGVRLDPLSRS